MLDSIMISGYRGIQEGTVGDLPRLGIFVGPNGAGKSSILEALLIGAHGNPAESVGRVVRSRWAKRGARWLFNRSETSLAIDVQSAGKVRATKLLFDGGEGSTGDTDAPSRNTTEQQDTVRIEATIEQDVVLSEVRLFGDNRYDARGISGKLPHFGQIRWLVPSSPIQAPLHDIYTEVVTQGRRRVAKEIIGAIVPEFLDVEVLVEAGAPVVHVVLTDHSVPAALMGDGIRTLVQLAFELAARPGGTVLVEEPEVHQHPGAIRQSAKAILEATRRGIQVLLSTHSLELIDALLAESTEADRQGVAVYRCRLDAGRLVTTRIIGEEVLFARGQILDDLR